MNRGLISTLRRGIAPFVLIGAVLGTGVVLAAWKQSEERAQAEASANQPEPVELVTLAHAERRDHHQTTTAIGTVLALQSITLRNELPGTVRRTSLKPGRVVEQGTVLVALDVSVEQAELGALRAEAQLADTMLARRERLLAHRAISEDDVDQSRAQRDVAHARMARVRAIIERKTLRAPFRARVGLADVHPGQYLNEGVELTTLQGLADEVHVDFAVAQSVAAGIRVGSTVEIVTSESPVPSPAEVVAVDARVDPGTRNATVRARLASSSTAPSPGASVRVLVPVGSSSSAVAIPVSALRKGPDGDHVWVIAADGAGAQRANERRVESGPVLGETVLVLGGLAAGEQIAAVGSFKLRDGVRVQTPPALAAAPEIQ